MRTLSKLSFLILGAALTTGIVTAQTPAPSAPDSQQQAEPGMHGHHGKMNPDRELKFLTKKLNLTSDQASQIRPILVDREEKMKALHADTSLAPDQKHAQMKSIGEEAQTKMNAILNETQQKQLAEMKAERREHGGRHGHQEQQSAPPAA